MTSSAAATAELTTRLIDAMTAKDIAATRRLLADRFTFTTPEGAAGDADAFATFLGRWGSGFPDFVQTPDQMVGDAATSASSFLFTGTNDGPLQTVDGATIAATGRSVEVAAAIFCTWHGGLLVNLTFFWDQLALLTQLGLA